MKRLMELAEKEIITLEELDEIEEMEEVMEVEDNGMSGYNVGHHWYTAKTNNGEYELYVK